MDKIDRRTFIKTGLVVSLGAGVACTKETLTPQKSEKINSKTPRSEKMNPTPTEIEGPFYPTVAQKDKDFDLTQIEGNKGIAKGTVVIIEGKVLDTDGKTIEDATVDLWQANAAGRYRHPHDSNTAALDANFQGWAIVLSGKDGSFKFKTVIPGAYPATITWMRPPHIHFKVSKKGYVELLTQMYFPGEKLNKPDRLLKLKNEAERKSMVATKINAKPETYSYNIVLQKA